MKAVLQKICGKLNRQQDTLSWEKRAAALQVRRWQAIHDKELAELL